jgi:serine O-acetyltransferase
MYKYGFSISPRTEIGPGFFLGHIGCITIHEKAIIGRNCNIAQGVTIGQSNRGGRKGYPVIGDNVFIGPGAVVIGRIKIGDNVAIGANSVVTKDVPDNAVVAGIPAKVISYAGSSDYVNHTDYEL